MTEPPRLSHGSQQISDNLASKHMEAETAHAYSACRPGSLRRDISYGDEHHESQPGVSIEHAADRTTPSHPSLCCLTLAPGGKLARP